MLGSSDKNVLDKLSPPQIIPPIRRAEYITAMQKSNKGDLNTLRVFVVSVIYEEMKSLNRLVESLVK